MTQVPISANIADKTRDIRFTKAALWGCLNASIRLGGSIDDGYLAAQDWLGEPIELWSPDGEWLWEGLVWTVRFGAGRWRRSRSLEGYANLVRVHWESKGGAEEPIVASDAEGILRYGTIEYQHHAGTVTFTAASNLADSELSKRRTLHNAPSGGGSGSASEIEMECYGVYRTLGYQSYIGTSTEETDITTVIQNMLAAKAPLVSNNFHQMQPTGILTGQHFDHYESVLEITKRLLAEVQGYTFGFGQNRMAYLVPSNRLSLTPTYTERMDGIIQDASGSEIKPWMVQPDTVLRQQGFASASVPPDAAAIDAIECIYLNDVTWSSQAPGDLAYEASVAGIAGEPNAY